VIEAAYVILVTHIKRGILQKNNTWEILSKSSWDTCL